MAVIHFFENRSIVLTQLLNNIPNVEEPIKIKGRKGIISNVQKIEDNLFHVHILFEQVLKNQPLVKDTKKKKR
ncbi:MAG: hypothetical protein ABF649_11405 [Bacillus sp. (in: firmicutes)]